ncbi:Predicted phosphohydrolase or phosphomutase, AlkP superfamily [Roseivivax halotolerans]|uniref:Predicted phosphohydrolase or phosphomutase, AlkP superfamily n=1 Tax=Roseivivax halotolerans TaxID=93684 RepID=A0A1I5WM84_9RHOB|nr:alkaline phosphatase family protein [Roseivivax halotolerans]SFQ20681.1 Predicted phosphohydrolase or phosphomutase, AlkP superfamily [Roseivivax halotolerans]
MSQRVLMIGLDGATFTLLKPLSEQGVLPFLTSLIRNGTVAHLMSTRNPLTPPAWTSMTTGVSPETHGIYDFLRPAFLEDGNVFLKINDGRDNRAESVFSMANRGGKRATALNFFGYYPAPQIDGYIASGFVPWKHLRGGIHPPAFFEELKASDDFDYRDLGMDIGEEKKVVQGLAPDEHEEWIELQNVRDKAWTDVMCRLLKEDPTELAAIVLDGPDKVQHLFYRYMDPNVYSGEPGEETDKITRLVTDFYARMDENIRRMVEAAGEDVNVIITSDHGFGPTDEIVYINQWLADKGYLHWRDGGYGEGEAKLAADKLKDHQAMIDWKRTRAFCPTPSSNAIFIKPDPGDGTGVTEDQYMDVALKLREELLAWTDKDGKPVLAGLDMNKMRGRPFVEPCPDITLKLRDGGFVSIISSDEAVKPRDLADGTHRPEGIFIGHGPAFRQDEQVDALNLLDITPLMLTLLGLPVPKNLEGRVPVEALVPGITATKAGTTKSAAATSDADRPEPTKEEREALLRQMKKLGYMD